MNFYPKPQIVGLDLDNSLIKSILATFDAKYLEWISINVPVLKKILLNAGEISERLWPIKYELVDLKNEMECLHTSIQNAKYVMIITDRSSFGVNTVIKRLPSFERMIKRYGIKHIQVRESFLSEKLGLRKLNVRESKSIKPKEDVFSHLDDFAKQRLIKPNEILIADDNRQVRMVARERGWQTFPDDIITVTSTKLQNNPALP